MHRLLGLHLARLQDLSFTISQIYKDFKFGGKIWDCRTSKDRISEGLAFQQVKTRLYIAEAAQLECLTKLT